SSNRNFLKKSLITPRVSSGLPLNLNLNHSPRRPFIQLGQATLELEFQAQRTAGAGRRDREFDRPGLALGISFIAFAVVLVNQPERSPIGDRNREGFRG